MKTNFLFMQRLLDIFFSLIGLILTLPIMGTLYLVGFAANGSPLFLQTRVGKDMKPFVLVKFRTMRLGAQSMATHLMSNADVTVFGHFLRRSKLDELPQLWNVLKGDMSLVGPRPCLFSQNELISERSVRGVFRSRPGITGLSQVCGIDMSTPLLLAETDARMLDTFSLAMYFKLILSTLIGRGCGDRVRL